MALTSRNKAAVSTDCDSLDPTELERREIVEPDRLRERGFEVVFLRKAWDTMHAHARSRTDVEVGGVLLGALHRDSSGPYLLIYAALPALAANQRSTSVSFTAESWNTIHETIDRDHAGAKIAGWYHTHPGFGLFLSEMDEFIQRSFFDLPHQVATVIDPIANTVGTFVWRHGKLVQEPTVIEGVAASQPPARRGIPDRGPITRLVARLMDDVARLDRKAWGALALLLFVVVYVVLYGLLLLLD
ncbi:MAG: Mov34/MPN/PAD-1 family protein [Tepidisphaeraceae bacterium]